CGPRVAARKGLHVRARAAHEHHVRLRTDEFLHCERSSKENPYCMNLNKLTEKAQEAVVEAQRLAESRQHTQIEPEHLLSALLQQEGGVVPAVLDKIGVPPARVAQLLETILNGFARSSTPQQVYASARFRRGL